MPISVSASMKYVGSLILLIPATSAAFSVGYVMAVLLRQRCAILYLPAGGRLTCVKAVNPHDVRFGSKADMCSAQADVRLVPKADMAAEAKERHQSTR